MKEGEKGEKREQERLAKEAERAAKEAQRQAEREAREAERASKERQKLEEKQQKEAKKEGMKVRVLVCMCMGRVGIQTSNQSQVRVLVLDFIPID